MKIKVTVEVEINEDTYEHVCGNRPTVFDAEGYVRELFDVDNRCNGVAEVLTWAAETEDGPITEEARQAAWEAEEAARVARAEAYEASRRNG